MKRTLLMFTAVVVMGFVSLFAVQMSAEAGKAYDNGDLKGTYYAVTIQVRMEGALVSYCSGYGTITFDGIGSGTADGTDRCTVTGVTHDTWIHNYSVYPDGRMLMWEVTDPADITHCQIVNNGRMLLCDGTSQQESLSFQATMVKQ